MFKVNLGSGDNVIKGFLNIDKYSKDADLNDDICHLSIEDNSVDLVYMSHVIEHFNKEDVNKVLIEIKRILKNGGVFIIETPDLECLSKKYRKFCFFKPLVDKLYYYFLERNYFDKYPLKYIRSAYNTFSLEDTFFVDSLFGGVKKGMEHYYIYNFRLLNKLLKKHGFKEIRTIIPPPYSKHRKSKCNLSVQCIKE